MFWSAVSFVWSLQFRACADGPSTKVSGPQSMGQDVRRALTDFSIAGPTAVLKGGASVTLHVETFAVS